MAETQANDIYRDGRFLPDSWTYLADDDPVPAEGAVFLSLSRFLADIAVLRGRNAATGVVVEAGGDVRSIADELAHVAAVAVSFPKFTDGRGYSTARILREDLDFDGEIRAIGDVLIDQIALMRRCGIDAFEVSHAPTRAALEAGHVPEVDNYYQPVGRASEVPTGTRPWLRRPA
ncbi:DUF934 domain-containing protein [Breoghania sp. JC706]|uniref:DUF934 domain-containing protein n=1 Tax=Breoghania sp. JC706 TaxID=3117732 RepID=UPI00300A3F54